MRVMVDANVLVAGVGWPRFPYQVLQHAILGDYQLVLCPFIIDEARRHILRLFPQMIENFETVLSTSNYEEVATPAKEEVEKHKQLVRDQNDVPIALSAITAQVDYLITQDKDFTDPDEPIHEYLSIILPGTFLRKHMKWTSEQLEEISRRSWDDLAN